MIYDECRSSRPIYSLKKRLTSKHKPWFVNMLILSKEFMLDTASNKGTISNMESLKTWFSSLIWFFQQIKHLPVVQYSDELNLESKKTF